MRARDTPVVAGVYFLFRDGELAYVGRSHDCYGRIASHRQKGREFDLATVMPLAADHIGLVEEALIRAYRPRSNRQVPQAKIEPPPAAPPTPSEPPAPAKPAGFVPQDRINERRPWASKYVPKPCPLGTITQAKARELALCFGLPTAIIAEAVDDGDLTFVESGKRTGKGPIKVALYSDVETFLHRRREARLIQMGLAVISLPSSPDGVSA